MQTRIPTTFFIDIASFLFGLLINALIITGGVGLVSGDILLFSFLAFLASLTLVFVGKSIILKQVRVPFANQSMDSRKNLTHRNDPLLM